MNETTFTHKIGCHPKSAAIYAIYQTMTYMQKSYQIIINYLKTFHVSRHLSCQDVSLAFLAIYIMSRKNTPNEMAFQPTIGFIQSVASL